MPRFGNRYSRKRKIIFIAFLLKCSPAFKRLWHWDSRIFRDFYRSPNRFRSHIMPGPDTQRYVSPRISITTASFTRLKSISPNTYSRRVLVRFYLSRHVVYQYKIARLLRDLLLVAKCLFTESSFWQTSAPNKPKHFG